MTDLADRIASLSPQKQALLAARLAGHNGAADGGQPLPAVNGPERLVAYAVARPGLNASGEELRRYLSDNLPAYMVPSEIVILDQLPLTPNGKVDRNVLPALAPRPRIERYARDEPRNEVEQSLAEIWADVLGLERVDFHDNFFEVGGDSILSIQIIARAHQAGLHLTPNQIFDHPTVAELAASIGAVPRPQVEDGLLSGPAPLTPIQHWFFEQNLEAPHHWNQALLLQAPADLDLPSLERILQQLLLHHDALRAAYRRTAGGWEQVIADAKVTAAVEHIDLARVPAAEQNRAIEHEADRLHAGFLLEQPPLLRAALFTLGQGERNRLLLVAHHLIVDAVSWRILLEDLETLYRQLVQGATVQLPAKTTSWRTYAGELEKYARSSERLQAERAYWLSEAGAGAAHIPLDQTPALGETAGLNKTASQRAIPVALGERQTHELLHKVPGSYRARVLDLLLAALAQTLAEWTGNRSHLIGLEGHGREAPGEAFDLSRTIGWFTSFFPVTITADPASPDAALKAVKEQLRRVPNRGIGFGLLRYLSPDPETRRQLAAMPRPQILFNYLGRSEVSAGAHFPPADGPWGAGRSLQNRRLFLLEINAQVVARSLQIEWTYSEELHNDATIRRLAERYQAHLGLLVEHCLSAETAGYTPSDFPLVQLDQSELDDVIRQAQMIAGPGDGRATANVLDDLYPLSSMQELMLLHTVSNPYEDTLLTQLRYTMEGNVDVDALRGAWQALVDRHPALRTGFLWEQRRTPLQLVYRQVQLSFEYVDLCDLPLQARGIKLEAICHADREQRFDPAQAPLMRVTLIRLEQERYELLWTSHHLILDRWCIDIVMREVAQNMSAGGKPGHQALPAAPYRSYIAWLQQQDQVAVERFWQARLAGFAGPTRMASGQDSAPDPSQPPQYRETHISIADAATAHIRRFARRHHLTLNTLLQAAWALLLSRHTGEQDVSFGIVVSGRPPALPGVESMIGSFVNNLPVRLSTASSDMLGWLRTIQQQMNDLRPYEHSSLVRIQEWSGISRRTPLFESLLVHQAPVAAEAGWAGPVKVQSQPGHVRTNHPLTLLVEETDAALSLVLVHDARLFEPSLVAQIADTVVSLLAQIVSEPAPSPASLSEAPQREEEVVADAEPNGQRPALRHAPGRKQNGYVAPKDVLEHQLVKIWELLLETEPVGIHDNFFELGGHSLLAVRLFDHIEETFGARLPATVLSQAATVEALADVMRRKDIAALEPVIAFRSHGAGHPLFYISPPGEAMLSYAYFVHHLNIDRPCYGLQPLGLDGEQAPHTTTEGMAAHFIREIRAIQPNGPYLLAGTCFGGMIAVEVGRQLQGLGQQIAFLGLLDTPFPNPTLGSKVSWHLRSLQALQPKDQFAYVLERIKRRTARLLGQFYLKRKRAVPAGLRHLYAEAGVAQATNNYIPDHYQGKITLFRARGAVDDAGADGVAWGWSRVATDGVDVHLVPGDHGSMMSEPHVHVLVEKFRGALAQLPLAQESEPG